MRVDHRVEERDACAFGAKIASDDFVASCVVEDISERGAKLRIDPDLDLPAHFTLALPLVDDMSDVRAVELRWRFGDAAGVRFCRSGD